MAFDASPITAFTLIAAPAVLTNAAAVLALSTSNRFSRTLDRARNLAIALDSGELNEQQLQLRIAQFERTQVRTFLLLRALSALYLSLATLAVASVFSIFGVTAGAIIPEKFAEAGPWIAAWIGGIGVATLAVGCVYLVKETRLAVQTILEEADHLRAQFKLRKIEKVNFD